MTRTQGLGVIAALLLVACGYTLEGAGRSRGVVRLEVPAVASTEPGATAWLRAALRRELAARGFVVDGGARHRLVVEAVRLSRDEDLAEVPGAAVLSGRTLVNVEALARLESAGHDWTVRAHGRADAPTPSAVGLREVRARLVRSALTDLARSVADRLEDGPLDGR